MNLHHRLAAAFALVLPLAFTFTVSPRDANYGFIARLGTDTIVVERVTVRDSSTVVEMLEVSPRVALTRYDILRDPRGRVRSMSLTSRAVNAAATVRSFNQRIEINGDSATITLLRGDSVTRGPVRIAIVHPVAPWMLYGTASYEMMANEARLAPGDSITVSAFALGSTRPSLITPRKVGGGRYALPLFGGQSFYASLNDAGELQTFSGRETTLKFEAVRTGPLSDFDHIVERFAAREKAAGQGIALSPRDTVRATILGSQVLIDYGRPRKRGRPILGGIVPLDTAWRTGANAATQITISSPLLIGELLVPAGSYTLFTLPRTRDPLLIINKQTGQWGTMYDPSKDLGRTPIQVRRPSAVVEELTINLLETGPNAGVLRISWDTFQWDVPIGRGPPPQPESGLTLDDRRLDNSVPLRGVVHLARRRSSFSPAVSAKQLPRAPRLNSKKAATLHQPMEPGQRYQGAPG